MTSTFTTPNPTAIADAAGALAASLPAAVKANGGPLVPVRYWVAIARPDGTELLRDSVEAMERAIATLEANGWIHRAKPDGHYLVNPATL
ncbi:MAG: hypothetical protein F4X66_19365 [Chloroflexi bacterium]|nr:hypothetical protein [Chloroflexota bacterium]MYE40724.1 hypothetical protein [Chloroflexota bacterium]